VSNPKTYDPELARGSAEWDALDREGIHKLEDGNYVISTGRMGTGSWRPGVFESVSAARTALRLDDEEIQALQDIVNAREADPAKRVITEAMLRSGR